MCMFWWNAGQVGCKESSVQRHVWHIPVGIAQANLFERLKLKIFSAVSCVTHSTGVKNTIVMLYADSACPAIQVPATTIRYAALCAWINIHHNLCLPALLVSNMPQTHSSTHTKHSLCAWCVSNVSTAQSSKQHSTSSTNKHPVHHRQGIGLSDHQSIITRLHPAFGHLLEQNQAWHQ